MVCADEATAVEFMEAQRWGSDPCCPRCGSVDVYQMKDSGTGQRQKNFRWLCRDCKKAKEVCQYTVRTGTVFEDSKIELRHWCFAFWRASTSKKGVSALEIHRQTGLSYKSCLFMLHRIRFAMAPVDGNPLTGIVECDETYVGGKPRHAREARDKWTSKVPVMALVERRPGGRIRPQVIADVTAQTLHNAIIANVDRRARIMTDEGSGYRGIGKHFEGGHHTVNHSAKEYARGDVTTNTVEGFFSILKRGLSGIYHSVSKEHLHRYLAEYEFRYNNRELEDGERTVAAIKAAEGKRLMYKAPTRG
jgi:transposase-like protein